MPPVAVWPACAWAVAARARAAAGRSGRGSGGLVCYLHDELRGERLAVGGCLGVRADEEARRRERGERGGGDVHGGRVGGGGVVEGVGTAPLLSPEQPRGQIEVPTILSNTNRWQLADSSRSPDRPGGMFCLNHFEFDELWVHMRITIRGPVERAAMELEKGSAHAGCSSWFW